MQLCMHTAFSSNVQVPTVQLICWADGQCYTAQASYSLQLVTNQDIL